jgi:hypothetical protein
VNVSATTTFSVTATNATGPGPTRSATVTLSTGGGGGGGGGAAISCPGYNNTIVMNLNYVPSSGQILKAYDGLKSGDIMVATFTTPATIAGGYGQNGLVGAGANNYATSGRGFNATFSTTPCSTTYTTSWPGSKPKGGLLGQSVSWQFNTYKLAPNTTYYVNITGDVPVDVSLTAK